RGSGKRRTRRARSHADHPHPARLDDLRRQRFEAEPGAWCEREGLDFALVTEDAPHGRVKTGDQRTHRPCLAQHLFRAGWSEENIAVLFGVTQQAVSKNLLRAKGCEAHRIIKVEGPKSPEAS